MSPAADGRKTGPERIPTSAAGRFFRAALARAYARVVGMSRDPTWIFFDTVLPLLAVASYVFLYKSMQAPRAFLGFVILGSSMIAFWLNVLWGMATMLYWEKEMGRLEQYLLAPTSRMALLLGLALAAVLFCLGVFFLIPITLGLDGMRQILYGSAAGYGFIPYRIEMIVLLALAVVYVLLARWALRTMENLSRREGRLTLRWQ